MKIRVIFGSYEGGYPPSAIEVRKKCLLQYVSPGVDVDFSFLDQDAGTVYAESIEPENHKRIGEAFFRKVIESERQGFDAVTLYGTLDPGIERARRLVKIPVINWGIATYHAASMLGKKMGVIVYEDSYIALTWRMIGELHMEPLVTSVCSTGIPLSQMLDRRTELKQKLIEVGRLVVSQGAEVIYPQGVSMIPLHYSPAEIAREVGVPVLNAMKIGFKMTAMLAAL
jgi:allantoin racemase